MMQISHKGWYYLAFGALIALAAFYACYRLSESPPTWYDEGIYVQVAEGLAQHGVQAIQTAPGVFESTGHVTGGYPFLAPVALSLKLLGNSLFAARVPMALFMVLCVLAAWLVIYTLHGPRAALLALALLSTFPLLYGNGKNVLGEVPGMLYVLLALYFVWQIEQRQFKGTRWYVFAGLFVGLAAATKPIFFLLPIAIGIVFLFAIRRVPWRWQDIAAAALACALPLLLWMYLQFGNADALSSVLLHYANPYAETSLFHTVLQNALRFFKEATPLYAAALMGAWLLAVGIRLCRRQKILLAEWAAFVFSILIMLAYVRTEGWYRYMFEAMMLGLIFLPVSLQTLASELERHTGRIKLMWLVPVPFVLLGAMQLYQLNYSSWVADHYGSTGTSEASAFFSSVGKGKTFFVYNTPDAVPFLHTTNYYQYIDPIVTVQYGKENLQVLEQGTADIVVLTGSEFEKNKDQFARYQQSATAGPYVILQRI